MHTAVAGGYLEAIQASECTSFVCIDLVPESAVASARMTERYTDRSNRSGYAEGRVVQLPNLSDLLWRTVSNYRPHRYPKSTGILALWLFGLFAVLLAPAPVKITPEKLDRYNRLVMKVCRDMQSECTDQSVTVVFLHFRLKVTLKSGLLPKHGYLRQQCIQRKLRCELPHTE